MSKERIRVYLRLRPPSSKEFEDAEFTRSVELSQKNKEVKVLKDFDEKKYYFDGILPETISQEEVYNTVCQKIVSDVFEGFNGTCFAYGQSGTGKTYTLANMEPGQEGVIPRVVQHMFRQIASDQDNEYKVVVNYVQIYMEMIQDLLRPESANMQIREDPVVGVFIRGVKDEAIENSQQFFELVERGNSNRVVALTNLNAESSRSHACLIIKIEKKRRITRAEQEADDDQSLGDRTVQFGKLTLVDLAGSERMKKTGAKGTRQKEAKAINLSLSALGNVVHALTDERSTHIPFRDSKLTRLLQDSLGGNGKTSIVITIGPDKRNVEETISSILFGQRAMKVVSTVRKNEDIDYHALCIKLQAQIDSLTDTINQLEIDVQKAREDESKINDVREKYEGEMSRMRSLLEGDLKTVEESSKKELQKTQEMFEEEKNEIMLELEDEVEQHEMDVAYYTERTEEYEARITKLEGKVRDLESDLEKNEAELTRRVSELSEEIDVLTEELENEAIRREELKEEMKLLNSNKSAEIEKLKEEAEKAKKQKINDDENHQEEIKKKDTEIANLTLRFERRVELLEKDKGSYIQQLKDIQESAKKEHRESYSQFLSLKAEMSAVEFEKKSIEALLLEEKERSAKLAEEIEGHLAKVQKQEKENAEISAKLADVSAQFAGETEKRISLEKELQESNKMIDEITASISMDDFTMKEEEDGSNGLLMSGENGSACNEVEDLPPENDEKHHEMEVETDVQPSDHSGNDGKDEIASELVVIDEKTSESMSTTPDNVNESRPSQEENTSEMQKEDSDDGNDHGATDEVDVESSEMDLKKEKEEINMPDISKITQFIQKIWHSSSQEKSGKRPSGSQMSIMGRIEHMLEEKSRETERFVVQLRDEFQSAMNATIKEKEELESELTLAINRLEGVVEENKKKIGHLENQLSLTEETLEKERKANKKLKDSIMDTETKYSHVLSELSHKWGQYQTQVHKELSTVQRILQGESLDNVLAITMPMAEWDYFVPTNGYIKQHFEFLSSSIGMNGSYDETSEAIVHQIIYESILSPFEILDHGMESLAVSDLVDDMQRHHIPRVPQTDPPRFDDEHIEEETESGQQLSGEPVLDGICRLFENQSKEIRAAKGEIAHIQNVLSRVCIFALEEKKMRTLHKTISKQFQSIGKFFVEKCDQLDTRIVELDDTVEDLRIEVRQLNQKLNDAIESGSVEQLRRQQTEKEKRLLQTERRFLERMNASTGVFLMRKSFGEIERMFETFQEFFLDPHSRLFDMHIESTRHDAVSSPKGAHASVPHSPQPKISTKTDRKRLVHYDQALDENEEDEVANPLARKK
eukprot:TRINITY_DN1904_c0_g1_i1.p1 TRINITY_DN1904_c0_g1~~TRINITY_DN1904_c0_g1_i1.p1  ORF type:complete len:1331 (+),score=456.95 TRINITY_DN1904_c0_g1_i1:142-4134(+)